MSDAFSAAAMTQISAERLVEHLRRSGYVVVHKPPPPIPAEALKIELEIDED